jgi:hypothetical protein
MKFLYYKLFGGNDLEYITSLKNKIKFLEKQVEDYKTESREAYSLWLKELQFNGGEDERIKFNQDEIIYLPTNTVYRKEIK